MDTQTTTASPWSEPGWLAEATAWIDEHLMRCGRERTGVIEQPHVRPWSCVLRIPTTAGDNFFKATAPALAHETALTVALARWRPDCTPELLAADLARGWILMPNGGTRLRAVLTATPEPDIRHWQRLLPLYAEMQVEMAERAAELFALRTMDRRLSALPAQYEMLLADTEALSIGREDGLTEEEYARLRALTPPFAALCKRLADYGLPETLQHDDLHDGNVFVRDDGGYTLFDWGDACVSPPFFSLLVVLRSIADRFGWANDAPELARLHDAYLEPWAHYGSRTELRAAADLAYTLGMVCRALTWHRILTSTDTAQRADYAAAVPGWLQEFLSAVNAAGDRPSTTF
jgi:hypothetical protein